MRQNLVVFTATLFLFLLHKVGAKQYNILDFGAIPDDTSTPTAFKNADAFMSAFEFAEHDFSGDLMTEILIPSNNTFTFMPVNCANSTD